MARKPSTSAFHNRQHGVWVPAFAGTTTIMPWPVRLRQRPHAALPSPASRCFSRGITSFCNSVSEWCQASGLCL